MLIWKHELPDTPHTFGIKMPRGSEILSVGAQDARIVLWFSFEEGNVNDVELRHFSLGFTGISMEVVMSRMAFIDTVQLPNGLVYHLFEVIGEEVDDG